MSASDIVATGISTALGASANRKAKRAREAALAAAKQYTTQGYDTAGNALDVGQTALEGGYSAATGQRQRIGSELGGVAQSTYGAQQDLWAPWMAPGLNAYQNLDKLLNDPQSFNTIVQQYQQTPQFQFQMQQATEQAKRSAAMQGNRLGANQIAALQDRAQGVASQGFDTWVNRLQQLAQTGMQATGQLSQAQSALGQGLGNALQYGDTSQWDINKGKDILGVNQQRGDLALQKASDLSSLALGGGQVGANYALAQGNAYQQGLGNMQKAINSTDFSNAAKMFALG